MPKTIDAPASTPIEMIKRELRRFLADNKPGVIATRGRWGVGKTHAWNEALKAAKKSRLKYKCYSYVSLFGVESLDKFKFVIAESQTTGTDIGDEPKIESVAKNWRAIGTAVLGAATGRGSAIADVVQMAAFVTVREQIVCIDDIERKGSNLRTMDVLGLASFLRERRGCKVVLILNDERLEEEKAEFTKYHEKVIDSTFLYAPTPSEAADIALSDNNLFADELKRRCVSLNISNIRVIKKIKEMILKVYPILKNYDQRILLSGIGTLALLGWAHFGEHETVGPPRAAEEKQNINEDLLTFIMTKYGKGLYGRTENANTPDEERWVSILTTCGFGAPDGLDAFLYEGVRAGYFDEAKIIEQANVLAAALKQGVAQDAWNRAWDLFHGSFDNNQAEVVGALVQAFRGLVKNVTVIDLNSIMKLLKNLGEPVLAREMLDLFLNERDEKPEFFELSNSVFSDHVDDPDLRKAFAEKAQTLRHTPGARDILLRIAKEGSWSPSDIYVLTETSVDQYCEIFRAPDDEHRKIIGAALSFRNIANKEYKLIVEKCVEALNRIAAESELNRFRVQAFGVNVN